MIFLSAGHHLKDPGAVANGYKEADLTRDLRDRVTAEIKKLGGSVVNDLDRETLSEYLGRIRTGTGSVVCEFHFNAGPPTAEGTECLVPVRYTTDEVVISQNICKIISDVCGIKIRGNKGMKTEAESARGSLAIMRKEGINLLPEICFITNKAELERYLAKRDELARRLAIELIAADKLYS